MIPGKDSLNAAEGQAVDDSVIEKLFQDDDDMDLDPPQTLKRRRLDQPSPLAFARTLPQKAIHSGATKAPINDKPFYLAYSLLGFIQFRNMQDYNVAQVSLRIHFIVIKPNLCS